MIDIYQTLEGVGRTKTWLNITTGSKLLPPDQQRLDIFGRKVFTQFKLPPLYQQSLYNNPYTNNPYTINPYTLNLIPLLYKLFLCWIILIKLGVFNKALKKRYFVLMGDQLKYYKTEEVLHFYEY